MLLTKRRYTYIRQSPKLTAAAHSNRRDRALCTIIILVQIYNMSTFIKLSSVIHASIIKIEANKRNTTTTTIKIRVPGIRGRVIMKNNTKLNLIEEKE